MKLLNDARLSKRQKQVAAMVINGMSSKEIARAFEISPNTVKACTALIYEKLEINKKTELIHMAYIAEYGVARLTCDP